MPKTPFRTAYGPHEPALYAFKGDPVSLTHQSEAPACDINQIMKRFQKTGVLEHQNTFEGKYGDFTDLPMDYHTSVNAVLEADQMFASLPNTIRKKFGNDPGNFLDFVADPKNAAEMVEMGLANAPNDVIERTPAETAEPAPTEPKTARKEPPKADE